MRDMNAPRLRGMPDLRSAQDEINRNEVIREIDGLETIQKEF